MFDKFSDDINVDEIMEKIKSEVAKKDTLIPRSIRRQENTHRVATSGIKRPNMPAHLGVKGEVRETKLFRAIKRVQTLLRNYPFYDHVNRFAKKLKIFIPKYQKQRISVSDLLNFRDQEFVKQAYRVLLQREPDDRGHDHFLSKLRSGQMNKNEILCRLRFSREGRQKRISIKGLTGECVRLTLFKVPAIGYLIRVMTAVFEYPKMLKRIQKYEAGTDAQLTKLSAALETKVDVTHVERTFDVLRNEQQIINTQINYQKINIIGQQRSFAQLLDEARKRLPAAFNQEQIENIVKQEDHFLDALYVAFEEQFRGTREDIKERLRVYLPYIDQAAPATEAPILDVGCGRGEWLQLLKEKGHKAKGIDQNRVMIQQCMDHGFDVVESDILQYLKKQKSGGFRAVTGFHVIEHLPFRTLIALFDEVLRVLSPGGVMILETPNPENLVVGACNFYLDPTHLNPLPPEPVKFLVEQRGFVKIEIVRLHKMNAFKYTGNEPVDELLFRMNMEQDYSIISYKM